MYFNLKRPHFIALGVVVVLTIVLLKLPNRAASQLKLAISGLFLPLFSVAGSVQQSAEKAGNSVVPREELVKELDRLRRENGELRARQLHADELARENARLRQQVGLVRQMPWRVKVAHVIARDPANWWRTLTINAGLAQGVVTNNPVISPEGFLVGRVSTVGLAQSQVVLLGDPDCRVSAMVEETRDTGVIAPASSSPLDNIIVDLSHLSRNSPLRPGQRVVTSGLGGIFPKGLVVGAVVDFRSIGYGMNNEARVKVAARLNAIEEVFVIQP